MRTAEMIGAVTYHFNYAEEEIPCTMEAAQRIREVVQKVEPDLVLIPWLFDNLPDHRRANILYAWGCADLELMVLAYEIWTMLDANAILDITDYIDGKMSMINNYESQLQTVDYTSYAVALSKVRAFRYPVRQKRQGAAEAFIALPNIEYCELVQNYYGRPGAMNKHVMNVIRK